MREFTLEDFPEINKWRVWRKVKIIPRELYPKHGFIEPEVAAGFINFSETMAFFENFITNPKAPLSQRETAIMEMVEALEQLAYTKRVKHLVAVTTNPKIEKYMNVSQWVRMPGKVYGKELSWE